MAFRSLTYNPGRHYDRRLLVDWLAVHAARVTFLSTQEFKGRQDELLAADTGLSYVPRTHKAVPLFYRPGAWRLEAHTAGALFLTPETYVGGAGAGPPTLRAKYLSYARFRNRRTHRTLWRFNMHAAPSIYLPRQPGADISRGELHARQVERAARFIASKHGARILEGDFNAGWGHRNMDPLRDIGMRLANGPDPTHGSRRIDLSLYVGPVEPVSSRVVRGVKRDDHDAVETVYRLTPRR